MTVAEYLEVVNRRYNAGISGEHSYRGDFQQLLEEILPDLLITNEPSRIQCGAPDYILTKKGVPIGYIEAKDIGEPLDGKKKHKEQFDRYKASLPNLIITDYLNFWLYVDSELVTSISIGEIANGQIKPLPDKFDQFEHLISNFGTQSKQTIRSPKKLAQMMAGKAKILSDVLENALTSDKKTQENTTLKRQMDAFREILIHDINPKQFADIYAQTIAYGMFAARLHDPNLDTFTRQEAAGLIPKTNPFLRKLFQYIAGYDLDDRIVWIVDELADLFRATDIKSLLQNFGKATQTQDPFIHFYETFLAEYDPKLRKSRGVWYTPEPVVNFIVRAVDDVLKTEFNLPQGLADTTKTKIKVKVSTHDKRYKAGLRDYEQEVHKVQILDPATGTGTFLAEVVKQIHNKFAGQEGIWSNYVENHLIPRLNGFELLMASYAMAHLKLDMLLNETGYKPTRDQRLKVYLTNSLEEHHPETGTLFASWLSDEANEANHIKRDAPVMCVIGNPPYSVSSTNKSDWIENLTYDYKRDLNEKNKQPLSDDYIKFIRYGQHFIDKNGSGVMAYVSNNSFIDGIIHRQMRKCLLESFDKIYILDVHGSTRRQEQSLDGTRDENVFDIQQGVSINIFIKSREKEESVLGKVYHIDAYGNRDYKYELLLSNSFESIEWVELKPDAPNYYFVNKDFKGKEVYRDGFKINNLFKTHSVGIVTSKDPILININKSDLICNVEEHYDIESNKEMIESIAFRIFDKRYVYYDVKIVDRARYKVMKHLLHSNLALIAPKQAIKGFKHAFISDVICDKNYIDSAGQHGAGNVFPLYIYPDQSGFTQDYARTPNLDPKTVNQIAERIKLGYTYEKQKSDCSFAPIDILDYIYAVLHSPTYREKYKELLKIDFPRIPYPTDSKTFWELVKLGGEIRQLHLLEHPEVTNYVTTYPKGGSNVVDRKMTKGSPGYELTNEELGRVWINDIQYFDKVPLIAWEFFIGGYQPAQKWLKDRKGRELSYEEIQHYQKIIVALTEANRLMKEINLVVAPMLLEESP